MANNERQFEDDVFALMTEKLGWTARKNADFTRTVDKAMDLPVFVKFLKTSQPKAWARFETACEGEDAVETLYTKFENEVGANGIVAVLKDGFRAKGVKFAAYFPKPENGLCDSGIEDYGKNICHIVRQWHYSPHEPAKSVDLMLAVNGIPLCAIELKDPFTGQTVAQAKTQWMTDRNPKEDAFRLNHRCIVFFAVDLNAVEMTTKLADLETEFLPFNQGSAGAGNDGGKGNPPWEPHDGEDAVATQLGPRAPTDYLWRDVLQKDSFLDIIQKFVNFDAKKKRLLFPRFHQLDVVRKLIGDVSRNGPGKNYLVQHSAGSGKSNSIAWVAYRLASLFNAEDKPMFNSVIIVTDRRVLDKQLQETVNSFNPKLGEVAVIDEKKHAKDLKQAIEDGRRIIVSTLQKFPVIFKDIKKVEGKKFAIIVDEAHSSQTGDTLESKRYVGRVTTKGELLAGGEEPYIEKNETIWKSSEITDAIPFAYETGKSKLDNSLSRIGFKSGKKVVIMGDWRHGTHEVYRMEDGRFILSAQEGTMWESAYVIDMAEESVCIHRKGYLVRIPDDATRLCGVSEGKGHGSIEVETEAGKVVVRGEERIAALYLGSEYLGRIESDGKITPPSDAAFATALQRATASLEWDEAAETQKMASAIDDALKEDRKALKEKIKALPGWEVSYAGKRGDLACKVFHYGKDSCVVSFGLDEEKVACIVSAMGRSANQKAARYAAIIAAAQELSKLKVP